MQALIAIADSASPSTSTNRRVSSSTTGRRTANSSGGSLASQKLSTRGTSLNSQAGHGRRRSEPTLRHPLRGFVSRFRFLHGFADSPVATCHHPLRGFVSRFRFLHGFADSPVATCRHPL